MGPRVLAGEAVLETTPTRRILDGDVSGDWKLNGSDGKRFPTVTQSFPVGKTWSGRRPGKGEVLWAL